MVKRHANTAFGAVYAFPGGVIDDCDREVYARCAHLTADAADQILSVEEHGLEFYSAAIRELFEETGLLLGHQLAKESPSASPLSNADLATFRSSLNEGALTWPSLLHEYGVCIDCNALHYFAHWITPVTEPRRFSTRFFMAIVPEGQHASHDERELTDSRWMTAADVLEETRCGNMRIIYPTYVTLSEIAQYHSVADMIAWARHRAERGVASERPAIVTVDGREQVVMPGDRHYPSHG